MAFSTSNRAQVSLIQETNFGVIPVAGNPNKLRMTKESLDYKTTTVTSQEIRSDRQVTDLIITGASAAGGIDFELSYKEYDTLFQAIFQGTWADFGTAGLGAVIGTSATFAANTLTAGAATTGTSLFTALKPGQWVGVIGSTIPGQNILAQVSKTIPPTSTVLTFEGTPFTSVTGNGGIAVQLRSSHLVNGTTERSFTAELALTDIGQFFAFRGLFASKLSISIGSGQVSTGTFDFMGKDSVRATATQLPGSPVASQTYDVMNGVTGVGTVYEGGTALTGTFIKSLKFDIDNKVRAREAIGTLGAVALASGTLAVTGTMEIYLADGALYDKFINNTATSLSVPVRDGAGNGYVWQFPKLKFNDANFQAGGLDQDMMLSIPFTALLDPVTGNTVMLNRVGA